ncbi:MAG: hypothetical protein ACOY9J_09620 [Pseudomonadota bacterium]
MTKRLVELDKNGRATEVCWKRLRRRALVVKEYLDRNPGCPEIPNLRERAMPLVNAALDGTLIIPNLRDPFIWEGGEGLLPADFNHVFNKFMNIVAGLDCDYANRVEKDGKVYAWVEFED